MPLKNGNINTENQSAKGDALKDVRVLNDDDTTFGLPGMIFYGGLAMFGALIFVMRSAWYFPAVAAVIYFMAMFPIHENDPRGLWNWLGALKRPAYWSGGKVTRRWLEVLEEKE